MDTQDIKLEYLAEYNAFGVADEQIEALSAREITPVIRLKDEDYARLESQPPAKSAPEVAFLLGREKGYYTVDYNYAKAVAQSGVKVRFLTYKENVAQMQGVDGLLLPGGSFDSPNEFYTDPFKVTDNIPGTRSYAYLTSIMEAEKQQMPMLGICAGSQMIGCMHGMRLYRNVKDYTLTNIEHKTKDLLAHQVTINPNSPLYEIMQKKTLTINSRHTEAMMPNDKISDLEIYASAPDGTPEAWGNEKKNILCIQWHPEDFAAQGDKSMQNIYNWLASKARIFQKQKAFKQQKINIQPILPRKKRSME